MSHCSHWLALVQHGKLQEMKDTRGLIRYFTGENFYFYTENVTGYVTANVVAGHGKNSDHTYNTESSNIQVLQLFTSISESTEYFDITGIMPQYLLYVT